MSRAPSHLPAAKPPPPAMGRRPDRGAIKPVVPARPPAPPTRPNRVAAASRPRQSLKPGHRATLAKATKQAVPLAASLLLHGGLLTVAFIAYQLLDRQVVPEAASAVTEAFVDSPEPAAMPPLAGQASRRPSAVASTPALPLTEPLADPAFISPAIPSLDGSGDSPGGKASAGAPNTGGAITPPIGMPISAAGPQFMGIAAGGNVRRIVYLVDLSGSMQGMLAVAQQELQASIASLTPIQSFNVVGFAAVHTGPFKADGLAPASAAEKASAVRWIYSLTLHQQDSAIPGIDAAFADKPQVVYVLTDGFDRADDFGGIRAEFARRNADKAVHVNTIFIDRGQDDSLRGLLADIARDNGGKMKIIGTRGDASIGQ